VNIYQHLLSLVPSEPVPIQKVVVGVHWTLVCSKNCGLSSTVTGYGPHGHGKIKDVGKLHLKTANELASWILSDNLLEASIGIAALNSLIGLDESKVVQVNAAEIIAREGLNKDVVIIGHFPFVDSLKETTRNCWVIEKNPFGEDFSEDYAQEFVRKADVVAITGTAFINHSIENLLSLCRKNALVLILGPSTPLAPILFDYGVDYLSGALVDDIQSAIDTITQGAILPQVKGIRLVSMRNEIKKVNQVNLSHK